MFRKKTQKHFHCKHDHLKNWRLLKLLKKYDPLYAGIFYINDCLAIVDTPGQYTQIHTCGKTARSVRRARHWQIRVRAGGQLVSRLERPGTSIIRETFQCLYQTWCVCFCMYLFCLLYVFPENVYIQERLAIDEVTIRGRSAIVSVQVIVLFHTKLYLFFDACVACATKIRTCMKTMNWSCFVAKCSSFSRKSISLRCRRWGDCVHRHMILDGRCLVPITSFVERQPCCAQRAGLRPYISGQIVGHVLSHRSLSMRCPVGLVLWRRGIRATGCRPNKTSCKV